jgi:hypothetical protein
LIAREILRPLADAAEKQNIIKLKKQNNITISPLLGKCDGISFFSLSEPALYRGILQPRDWDLVKIQALNRMAGPGQLARIFLW